MPRVPDRELEQKKKVNLPQPKAPPLTPEMRKRISKEKAEELRLKAELEMEEKLDKEAEDAYLEEVRQVVIREKRPDEALRSITIDLPPEAPYLLTNGTICYYPDEEYMVTKAVYDDLNSRMWMAWINEANRLDDRTANQYRRKLNAKISRKGVTYERFT